MNEREAIKKCLEQVGWSQQTLSEHLGYNTQSAVGNRLNGNRSMIMRTVVKFVSAMGYEVVIRSKSTKNRSEWVITYGDEEK